MRMVIFSVCSVALAVVVICWVAGVLPPSSRAGAQGRPGRGGGSAVNATEVAPAATEDGLSVYFSPGGGCTDAMVREIGKAKDTVFVQAAQFTSAPIAKALIAAKARGVDVRVVVDRKKDDEDSQTSRLVASGVATFIDGKHHTAHNKVMLIDHRLIITGSFNFTRESEAENAENVVMIDGKSKLVTAYEANFKEHLGHSVALEK